MNILRQLEDYSNEIGDEPLPVRRNHNNKRYKDGNNKKVKEMNHQRGAEAKRTGNMILSSFSKHNVIGTGGTSFGLRTEDLEKLERSRHESLSPAGVRDDLLSVRSRNHEFG